MLILYWLVSNLVINFHCKQRRLRLKNYYAGKLGEGNQSKHISVQVILHLIQSHLFIVAFISFTLGDGSTNITVIYVKGCFSCVFLEKLYIIQLYI